MYIYDRALSALQSRPEEQLIASWPAQGHPHPSNRVPRRYWEPGGSGGAHGRTHGGLGEFSARELSRKLKYLSFLPHFAEARGTDVPLTPTIMDPGIYDGPVKYRIAPRLQDCLMDVMKRRKDFQGIKVALVDLTKVGNHRNSHVIPPEFAGYYHKTQVFAASVPKVAAMLAAYQVHQDLRVALERQGPKTMGELFELVRRSWAETQRDPGGNAMAFASGLSLRGKLVLVHGRRMPLSEPKAPHLERVFADVPAGSPARIEFATSGEDFGQLKAVVAEFNGGLRGAKQKLDALGFLERMGIMVGGDVPASNYATSTIVRDVGFSYIASTLLQSGLYDTTRAGGLWLGADYWGSSWSGPPGGGSAQSATPGSLAAFMTLLVQNRLVSRQASEKMGLHLQKVPTLTYPGTGSWFGNGLHQLGPLKTVWAKVGLAGGGADDFAFIEREVGPGGGPRVLLRYVAVALRAPGGRELEQLILELDKCILQNNGLTPAQGGHP